MTEDENLNKKVKWQSNIVYLLRFISDTHDVVYEVPP